MIFKTVVISLIFFCFCISYASSNGALDDKTKLFLLENLKENLELTLHLFNGKEKAQVAEELHDVKEQIKRLKNTKQPEK